MRDIMSPLNIYILIYIQSNIMIYIGIMFPFETQHAQS